MTYVQHIGQQLKASINTGELIPELIFKIKIHWKTIHWADL